MKHNPLLTQLILGDVLHLVNGNIAVVIRTRAIAVRLNIPLGGAFAKLKPSHPKEVSSYPCAGGIYRICQSEEDDMSFWIVAADCHSFG